MKELIRKELLVNKYYFLITLFFLPIASFSVSMDNELFSYFFVSLTVVLFTVIAIQYIAFIPREAHIEKLYLSLPLDRKHIIKSKYLLYSLYPIAFSTTHFITYIFKNSTSSRPTSISFGMLIIPISLALIILGIMVPLRYIWTKKYQIIETVFYLFIVMGQFTWQRWIGDYTQLINVFNYLDGIVLLFIATAIYLLSMKVSETLYRRVSSRA